ncbi:hypothetical protein Cni_G05479 [Canna indica]|uniref:Uncharacterized protein n=1 Tax=Canna indica TaxID=4628 RepID=A0AAQ3Q5G2_9LILI|nr:hypothetical protein Cni_G05479 [Canna indica]
MFFPSLFSLLLNCIPIVVCTTLLLGVLLSNGEPNIPANEEGNKSDISSVANDPGAKHEERFKVKANVGSRRATKRLAVRTIILGDIRPDANIASIEVEENGVNQVDSTYVSSSSLLEEDNSKKNFIKHKEHSTEKPADVLLPVCKYTGSGEKNTTILHVDGDKTKLELDQGGDSCLGSPWHHIDHKDASSSVSESDGSNHSMANAMPVLDELDPLVSRENFDDGSVASSHSNALDDGSAEEDEIEIPDDEDDEEAQDEKEDENKVVVAWTADDQRNLVELGNSEIERNRWLEKVIAKRKARKIIEKNLIDLDDDMEQILQSHGHLPSINAPRRNPFDLPYDSDDSVPGSAPSVLLPRPNPFDLPSEQADDVEESPSHSSSHKEFAAVPQRDMFVRRHESFSIGSIFELKQERRVSRFRPYFVPEKSEAEYVTFPDLHRELSEISDSKMSSTLESEAVSSSTDHEHENDLHQDSESSTKDNAEPTEQETQTMENFMSVNVERLESQVNIDHNDDGSHHDIETEDNISEDSAVNSSISDPERAEEKDEEYEPSSSNPSEEEKNNLKTLTTSEKEEKTRGDLSKGSTAGSDAVNEEEEHVHDSHVVEPVYDSSPTATERSHSNSALDEASMFSGNGTTYKGGSPPPGVAERNASSDGSRTEESQISNHYTPWVPPPSLAFVEQNESVSREISIIKELDVIGDELSRVHEDEISIIKEELDVIGDELSRVHEDLGNPILPVLPEAEFRQWMPEPKLSSVEITSKEDS